MMARLNSFSIRIIGGEERDDGYVLIKHGHTYKIRMRNDRDVDCDVDLTIDGVDQGTFRISSHSSLLLERPANKKKYFTFFRLDSDEGEAVKPETSSDEYGVISATFKPARKVLRPVRPVRPVPPVEPWKPFNPWRPDRPDWWGEEYGYSTFRQFSNTNIGGGSVGMSSVEPMGGSEHMLMSCSVEPTSYDAPSNVRNLEAGVTGLTGHSDQSFYTVSELDYDMEQAVTIQLRLVCDERADRLEPLTPVVRKLTAPPPIR